jgi:hypothetical protein
MGIPFSVTVEPSRLMRSEKPDAWLMPDASRCPNMLASSPVARDDLKDAPLSHGDYRMTMLYTPEDLERRRHSIEAIENRVLGSGKQPVGANSAPK